MKAAVERIIPLGYKVNALASGIKSGGKLDLGLILSVKPARAAGLFTSNKVVSGSVKLSQNHLKKSKDFKAIIVNSGNANCFSKDSALKKPKNQVVGKYQVV